MSHDETLDPGWYPVNGDPDGAHRYWDGSEWVGEPQPRPPAAADAAHLDLGRPLAGPGRRIAARLIDVGLLIGVSILVRALVDDDIGATETSATAAILTLMATIAYEVGMVAALGATVGKLVMGIRIVDADGTCPPTAAHAIRRWAPNALAIIPVVGILAAMAVLIASLIWIFTDPMRRSIFDRAARTFVIET